MALAAGIPLALGGVHRPTILAASLIAYFGILVLWWHRMPTHRGLRLPWYGGVLLIAFAWTLLQLVPLPVGLLRKLAPATVEVLEVSLGGSGGAGVPAFHPISLDPSATLWEALKIGTCALAFILAHNFYFRRGRRNRLLLAVVVAGAAATLLGFIGAVAAPGKPLMFYEPVAGRAGGLIATSFVNPNHGSAFLTICTALAVGLAVAAKDMQQRVLLGLAAVLLGAGVFLSLSRGGILSLGVAFAALAVLLVLRRSSAGSLRAALVPGTFALVLLLSGWLAYDAIVNEFKQTIPELNTNLGKVGLWAPGLAMVRANPIVGVGRGAFLTAFPRYLSGEMPRTATYSHLEMQYLHLPAEWGSPMTLLLLLGTVVAFIIWLKRSSREPQVAAIAAALVALAAHAFVDFNLEVLGVALPAAILAGALSADDPQRKHGRDSGSNKALGAKSDRDAASARDQETGPSESREKHVHRRHFTRLVLFSGFVLVSFSAWLVLSPMPMAEEDLARLSEMAAQKAPLDQIEAAAAETARRHPADPMPHLLAGSVALQQKQPQALRWLNRANFLFPASPVVHLETARALRTFGHRRQALLEYRLALENQAASGEVLPQALSLTRNLEELEISLPPRPGPHADAVMVLLGAKRLELAEATVTDARRRWPSDISVAAAEVELQLALKKSERAVELARALAQSNQRPELYRLWARAAAATPQPKAELPVLQEARRLFPKDESFTFALAEAHLRAKEIQPALELANSILEQAASPATLAQAHDLLSRINLADGRPHRAQYEAEQARKIREGH